MRVPGPTYGRARRMKARGINGVHYAATVEQARLDSISLAAQRICMTRVPVSCEPSRSASLDRVTRYRAVSSSTVRRGRIPICSRARPRPSTLGRQRNVMTSISAVRCSASSRTVIFDAFMCARVMTARNSCSAVSKQSGEFSASGTLDDSEPFRKAPRRRPQRMSSTRHKPVATSSLVASPALLHFTHLR